MSMLKVSSSPHVRDKATTQDIMLDVCIAVLPAAAFGCWQFGFSALFIIIATTAAAVLSEYIYERCMNRPITIYDGSAMVTGLILALNMPPQIPIWIPILGAVFAIIIIKQLFGGLGHNWMNPALGARCFLLISFLSKMTDFSSATLGYDSLSGATALATLKDGGAVSLSNMFFGREAGTIGEVSVLMLLIGALYLLIRKVISIKIPAIYIITVAIFTFIFGKHDGAYVLAQICGGGLVFGAFFMATDYVTSPVTPKGQIIYSIAIGLLTGIFRIFGSSAEGVSYAILLGNILTPLIDKATIPAAFGRGKNHEK